MAANDAGHDAGANRDRSPHSHSEPERGAGGALNGEAFDRVFRLIRSLEQMGVDKLPLAVLLLVGDARAELSNEGALEPSADGFVPDTGIDPSDADPVQLANSALEGLRISLEQLMAGAIASPSRLDVALRMARAISLVDAAQRELRS